MTEPAGEGSAGKLPKGAWAVLAATTMLRLALAAGAPLANDEAYYWDWARWPQLSYYDHPPGVAWLAGLAQALHAPDTLGARLLLPFVHLAATLLLVRCLPLLAPSKKLERRSLWTLLALTELVPAFHFEGLLLLPDSGLLLALAGALLAALKLSATPTDAPLRRPRRWVWALGASLGFAGLCKYHAAPIAVGLGIGMLLAQPRERRLTLLGRVLIPAALIAVFLTLPVWIWNGEHSLASFRYQGAHGFSELGLSPLAALRVYLGQAVILTPLVWISVALCAGRCLRSKGADLSLARIAAWAFLPLAALITVLAFGKQLLPHWIAPAYWMMLPVFARTWGGPEGGAAPPGRIQKTNLAFALLVSYILPWILAAAPLRTLLINSFHGKPGPLSELTLWHPLADAFSADTELQAAAARLARQPGCPGTGPVYASLRWFWTAQLAFNLPGQPRVYNLDFNHPSYYSYRDRLSELATCPVLILGDRRHLDRDLLAKAVVVEAEHTLIVPSHSDTDVVALLGHFRPAPELALASGEIPSTDAAGLLAQPAAETPTAAFRTLTLSEALQVAPTPGEELGPLCAALPPIEAHAPSVQAPSPLRARSSINLGRRLAGYLGDLHSHTALSDADEGDATTAYRYARDVAKLDFFAVTDHPEYWLLTQKDHYEQQKAVVAAEARPGYVPLLGFEYSSSVFGHYVVLNNEHIRNSFQDLTLDGFYRWLAEPEQAEALVIFAHPGFHFYRQSVEFGHFALRPELVKKIIGLEVIHWDGYRRELVGYGGELPFFDEALLAGWRLGAMASQDNHGPNWGTRDMSRIGLLLPGLSKAEVLDALRSRRFYATRNKDLQFAVNVRRRDGTWAAMGDTLAREDIAGPAADLRVRYYDRACQNRPKRLELVVNGRIVAAYRFPEAKASDPFPAAGEWAVTLPVERSVGADYYAYVRFIQGEDEETYTQSSPIYFHLMR